MLLFKNSASYKDSSGFVFYRGKDLYRQVNKMYRVDYDNLINSGLYKRLVDEKMLIKHFEANIKNKFDDNAYKILKPELIPFVSYPYEWSFSQLKDAALLTLAIHKTALNYGMGLKDATFYNIQFLDGKPIFIDTLSFEKNLGNTAWVAYRQFCENFLAPLSLQCYIGAELGSLLKNYINGLPLELTAKLLPKRVLFNLGIDMHVILHAKSQSRFAKSGGNFRTPDLKMQKNNMLGLIDSLESTVRSLKLKPTKSEWGVYYQEELNYSKRGFAAKRKFVEKSIKKVSPRIVWDLGANDGYFSRVVSKRNIFCVAMDSDPYVVDRNYRKVKSRREKDLLPLVMDLTNPSPGLGFLHTERMSLAVRGPADMVFALALIHHLVFSCNLSFEKIVDFLSLTGKNAVVEFVPRQDKNAKFLMGDRKKFFTFYTQADFEVSLKSKFVLVEKLQIPDSVRVLYFLKRKK